MQTLQRFAITAVFTLTCFTVPVLRAATLVPGSGAGKGADRVQPRVPVVGPPQGGEAGAGAGEPGEGAGQGGSAKAPGQIKGPGAPEEPPALDLPGGAAASGLTLAEQIRQLTDQFKREQKELLQRYQDMFRKGADPKSEERNRIREQLRQEFNQFRIDLMNRQKELRDEIRRRYEEFRKEHPAHKDLIDAAKERARDRIRERRGHGGD